MTEHYFTQQPHSKSSPQTWDITIDEKTYTFTSDIGVFSKQTVDFGSKQLIKSFTPPSIKGDILDLGCGYGPMGIILASRYPEFKFTLVDINERAIKLARKNVENNKISSVECILSDRFKGIDDRSFSAIVLNPPIRAGKELIFQMYEESEVRLLQGGDLWVVIQKKQGAASTKKKLESLFKDVQIIMKNKGYYILKAIK